MKDIKKNTKGKKERSIKVKNQRTKREEIKKGTIMECQECGMVVVVDEVCGCEEYHPIICCDEPMQIK